MRAAILLVALAACAPDIASGSYLCGPNASCPEGQSCNGPDNICVLPGAVEAFSCDPDIQTEPDDTSAQAHVISNLSCISVPFVNANCMLQGDREDWVKFVAPTGCAAIGVDARVSFPIAFERLGLELWNLDTNTMLAEDSTCTSGTAANGEDLRCLSATLSGGTTYGIQVHPAGEGDCNGSCAYNRYTLRVLLATP